MGLSRFGRLGRRPNREALRLLPVAKNNGGDQTGGNRRENETAVGLTPFVAARRLAKVMLAIVYALSALPVVITHTLTTPPVMIALLLSAPAAMVGCVSLLMGGAATVAVSRGIGSTRDAGGRHQCRDRDYEVFHDGLLSTSARS